jgi:HEPN domain-containing protein
LSIDPVQEWIDLARQDEASARFLLQMRPLPLEVICFHCQQAAEKLIKAVLAKHGLDIPKTHDLPVLLDLAAEPVPSLAVLDQPALDLNAFSVLVRYPSHIPLEKADAKDALEAVEAMKAAILSSLLD